LFYVTGGILRFVVTVVLGFQDYWRKDNHDRYNIELLMMGFGFKVQICIGKKNPNLIAGAWVQLKIH
jgi:hypothetical protein